jgi:hypothetical protein
MTEKTMIEPQDTTETAEQRATVARKGILWAVTHFVEHYFDLLAANSEAYCTRPELVQGLVIELKSEELADLLRRRPVGEIKTVAAYRRFVADHLVRDAIYRVAPYDLHPLVRESPTEPVTGP